MASFIVEDGTGLTNSTSYISVLDADDYLSLRSGYSLWEAVDEQENYLMWATRLLDQRAAFRGSKAVSGSALRWPRVGVCDRDGIAVDYQTIPEPIKAAVAEIAFHLATQGVDPSVPISTSGEIKRIKADVVEIEYVEGTASSTVNYFPVGINDILAGLGSISTGTGSRFVRIMKA